MEKACGQRGGSRPRPARGQFEISLGRGLKLTSCLFLEFSFNIVRPLVDCGAPNPQEAKRALRCARH